MEINATQMQEIAKLAQSAGPEALKGLNDIERRAMAAMMKALQKHDNPFKVKELNEHEFKEMKEYLKKAATQKQAGHQFKIPDDRKRDKERFKGIKNIARYRIGTVRLEKEIDRALQSLQPETKGSDIIRKIAANERKIAAAQKRLETIQNESRINERRQILDIVKHLQHGLNNDRAFHKAQEERENFNAQVASIIEQALPLIEEEHVAFELQKSLQQLNMQFDQTKILDDVASFLRPFPTLAKQLELLRDYKILLDDLMLKGPAERETILKAAIADQEDFLNKVNAELKEQQEIIASCQKALLKMPSKQQLIEKRLPQINNKKINQQIKQIELKLKRNDKLKTFRERIRNQIREKWLEIKTPEERTKERLRLRLEKIDRRIKKVESGRSTEKSVIFLEELKKHRDDINNLMNAKTLKLANSLIEKNLNPETGRGKEDRLIREYNKTIEALRNQKTSPKS